MRDEQRTVDQIKACLLSATATPLDELRPLAEHYRQVCETANARLARCDQYLRQKLRTEAVELAEQAPPALELAAVLDFHGVEAWAAVCRRHGLAEPPPIPAETVSWLNRAYVEEFSVGDLMAAYRGQCLQGAPLPKRMQTLRLLAKRDVGEASNWAGDLAQCEKQRLEEVVPQLRMAAKKGVLRALEAIEAELTSPDWIVKPSAKLLEFVEKAVRREREKEAEKMAVQIAAEAWDAYGAFDTTRGAAALKRWGKLIAEGYFHPTGDVADQVLEVQEWLDEERRSREEEEAFRRAVHELTVGVANSHIRRAELERLLYEAEKHGKPLDDRLRNAGCGTCNSRSRGGRATSCWRPF